MANWDDVRHVRDGQPVDAANAGRPGRALEARTDRLKQRMDEAELGRANVSCDVPLAEGARPGLPVYWDPDAGRFDLARAAVVHDPGTGALALAPEADCLGLCLRRGPDGTGDVVHAGCVALDLAEAVGGAVAAGRYYLSAAEPGRLVLQSPAVSAPVCFADGEGRAYVSPAVRNFLTDHVHFRFELACEPAGSTSPPAPGARHEISAPDPSRRGWLPAGHVSFGGAAPPGAAWGYNLAAHPELDRAWPPVPAGSACLFLDRDGSGGVLVPSGPEGGLAILDEAGIWWTSDCEGEAPWPADYDSDDPPAPPGPPTGPPTCPRPAAMRIVLAYGVDLFASRWSVVTRLESGHPALVVTGPDGGAASAGPLRIGLDLPSAVAPGDAPGGRALKGMGGDGRFLAGYVAEALVVGPGLLASSSHPSTTLVEGEAAHRGVVRLDVAPAEGARELSSQVAYLDAAAPKMRAGVPYYALPAGRESRVVLQFDVPSQGVPASPTLAFRARLLGLAAGTLPALTVEATVLPRPSGAPGAMPAAAAPLAFPSAQAAGVDRYVEVESAPVAAPAGSTVVIALSRSASDGYAGEVGLLRHGGVLGAQP